MVSSCEHDEKIRVVIIAKIDKGKFFMILVTNEIVALFPVKGFGSFLRVLSSLIHCKV